MSRVYRRGADDVHALEHVSLTIDGGLFVALMGPSGSGKSTLLNLLSGIDRPSGGEVVVAGRRLNDLSEDELARWRSRHVGLIFQFYNLIPVLSALENVELPLLLTSLDRRERLERARIALDVVGLAARARHVPSELSGGEQQRVAIARAIVTDPDLIIADEPTGDLDAKNADDILRMLLELSHELQKTVVMVTHDRAGERMGRHGLPPREGRAARDVRGRCGEGARGSRVGAAGATDVKYLPLVFRNLLRNKLRTALTGGAIGLAMLLVCFFMIMPGGIDRLLSEISSNVRVSVTQQGRRRLRHALRLRAARAEHSRRRRRERRGAGSAAPTRRRTIVTFPSFAIDPGHGRRASGPTTSIDPLALEKFRRQRDAAIVGRETMKKYHWRIGQQVSLVSTVWPVTLSFRIVGEIPNDRAPHFWIQREYLAQAMQAQGRDLDTVGHDLGAGRRSDARAERDDPRRRDVPQQPRRGHRRDREVVLRELLRLAAVVRADHPGRDGAGRALRPLHRRQHREHGGARAQPRDRRPAARSGSVAASSSGRWSPSRRCSRRVAGGTGALLTYGFSALIRTRSRSNMRTTSSGR